MEQSALHLLDAAEVKNELAQTVPSEINIAKMDVDQAVSDKADSVVNHILGIEGNNLDAQHDAKAAIESMSAETQKQASHRSAMLKDPISKLAERGEDGGSVANALVDLKLQVEELDPGQFDLEAGWFTRFLGMIPGIGTPLKRYFTKFESASTVIDAITRSLKGGKEQLKRDNVTLTDDQKIMRELTKQLEDAIKLGQMIDEKLSEKLSMDIPADDPRAKFIAEEIIFPLRQRIMDLQQQLAVNQQGVLTIEIIIRNNKELIRGVDRAVNVTVNALAVAVTLAMALANQKIVLEKIEAVNKTTDALISGTAKRLKQQGAAIHKQASATALDMDSLKSAFKDIESAMQDISTYRQKALPVMAKNIQELDQLTAGAEAQITKMEKANKEAGNFTIELG